MHQPLDRRMLLSGLSALAGAAVGVSVAKVLTPECSTVAPVSLIDTQHGTILAEPPPTGADASVKLESGQIVRMRYMWPYVPVPGDQVAVSVVAGGGNKNAVIIGGHAGRSGNLAVNGDFAAIPALKSGQPPYLWGQHRISGGNATRMLAFQSAKYHKNVMILESCDSAGELIAYSAAFPVQPGESIRGDATMTMDIFTGMSVDVDVRIAWLADLSGGYPKPVAQSVLDSHTIAVDGDWIFEGQAKAPNGAGAARIAVRAKHAGAPDTRYTLTVGSVYASR